MNFGFGHPINFDLLALTLTAIYPKMPNRDVTVKIKSSDIYIFVSELKICHKP